MGHAGLFDSVCVYVCAWAVFGVLGIDYHGDEEVYELTRHQIAFCCCLHLFWSLVSVVSTIPISERIMLVICKLISSNCNWGKNYICSCMEGGGKAAQS